MKPAELIELLKRFPDATGITFRTNWSEDSDNEQKDFYLDNMHFHEFIPEIMCINGSIQFYDIEEKIQ